MREGRGGQRLLTPMIEILERAQLWKTSEPPVPGSAIVEESLSPVDGMLATDPG